MITQFREDFDFLSNFYILPRSIVYDTLVCSTSEHLYQAFKSNSRSVREIIVRAGTPREAQLQGRSTPLRDDWDTGTNLTAMHLALILKFSANQDLLYRLLDTGERQLIEGNYWCDNYWGHCSCDKCADFPGQNNLGILLMQVRALFRQIG